MNDADRKFLSETLFNFNKKINELQEEQKRLNKLVLLLEKENKMLREGARTGQKKHNILMSKVINIKEKLSIVESLSRPTRNK